MDELGTIPGSIPARDAAVRGPRRVQLLERFERRPLYRQVLIVNGLVVMVAAALLAATPLTVSSPVHPGQVAVLAAGVVAIVAVDALLLRFSFGPLSRLVALMGSIDLLQPGQRLPATGGAEVRTVIEAFNAMLARLEAERRASSARALRAEDAERRRVGQELHDEIGQRLTGLLLMLESVAREAPDEVRDELAQASEATRETLDEVGRLAWQVRPAVLDDLGLIRALESLAHSCERRGDLVVRLDLAPAFPADLDRERELAIYRVAQESLTNAMRHSRATTVELTLERRRHGVVLTVKDDGGGFTGVEAEGWGIRGMRERALLVGGDLRVVPLHRDGVLVQLDVPLP